MCRITACHGFAELAYESMFVDSDVSAAVSPVSGMFFVPSTLLEFMRDTYGQTHNIVPTNFDSGTMSLYYETDDGRWLVIEDYTIAGDLPGLYWEYSLQDTESKSRVLDRILGADPVYGKVF